MIEMKTQSSIKNTNSTSKTTYYTANLI